MRLDRGRVERRCGGRVCRGGRWRGGRWGGLREQHRAGEGDGYGREKQGLAKEVQVIERRHIPFPHADHHSTISVVCQVNTLMDSNSSGLWPHVARSPILRDEAAKDGSPGFVASPARPERLWFCRGGCGSRRFV